MGEPTTAAEIPEASPAAQQSPIIEEIPIASVIEEPEQIEVQQADPQRAEVVDLMDRDEPAAAPVATDQARWSPAEEAELAKGLLTVVLG